MFVSPLVFGYRQLTAANLASESTGLVALSGVTVSTVQNDLTFQWLQGFSTIFSATSGA